MTVVVLNGPAGVGKTTTGRRLAAAVPNGVCIRGDALRSFVVTREPARPSGLAYAGSATLAGLYLRAGYQRVVVEFVFEGPEHLDRFTRALPAGVGTTVFTLWAPLEVVTAREAARPDRERLGGRVAECWQTMAGRLDQLGQRIDADRPLSTVVADIERRLGVSPPTGPG